MLWLLLLFVKLRGSVVIRQNDEISIESDNFLGEFIIKDEYTISFKMRLLSIPTNDATILHVTGNDGTDSSPKLIVPANTNSLTVIMRYGVNEFGITQFSIGGVFINDTETHVSVKITQARIILYKNDELIMNSEKGLHTINVQKRFWISNSFDYVPDATISNITVNVPDTSRDVGELIQYCPGISSSWIHVWYRSTQFQDFSTFSDLRWLDSSGNGHHLFRNHVDDSVSKHPQLKYVYGTRNDQIIFPELSPFPVPYTFIHLTKYNGNQKSRIWQDNSPSQKWLSGHENGKTGIAYHGDGYITNQESTNHDWLLSTDQFRLYRANRINRTINPLNINEQYNIGYNIGINIEVDRARYSDFALYEALFFNVELSQQNYECVENYFWNMYTCNGNSILGTHICSPTETPTANPSQTPSNVPTQQSTTTSQQPTINPSLSPTISPSLSPSLSPTPQTNKPSTTPSQIPTINPSLSPTLHPSVSPIKASNNNSLNSTSVSPSVSTVNPTESSQTANPTLSPSDYLTELPTINPTTQNQTDSPSSIPMIMQINPSPKFPAKSLYHYMYTKNPLIG